MTVIQPVIYSFKKTANYHVTKIEYMDGTL